MGQAIAGPAIFIIGPGSGRRAGSANWPRDHKGGMTVKAHDVNFAAGRRSASRQVQGTIAAVAFALTVPWTPADAGTKDITIALVLNDLTNPVSLPLRKGAEDAATELGFKLI